MNVTTVNGRTTAPATVSLTRQTGATVTQIFPLVKEDDGWHVCQ